MQSDDAIAALMDQLREQQGYDAPTQPPSPTKKQHLPGRTMGMERLLPELDGYPDSSYLAGNHSIWNPFVAPHDAVLSWNNHANHVANEEDDNDNQQHFRPHLPTNAQVEIIRRRVFEKFKQDCTEALQRIQQSWGIKLPIPAMLEKWHMDAKLVEVQESLKFPIKDDDDADGTDSDSDMDIPILASTEAISLAALSPPRQARFMEPILLNKKAPEMFRATLEPEVKKAWKAAKEATDSSVFPRKFGKQSGQIQKALFRFVCIALESFQQQLVKAVNLEKQQTFTQRNHSHRRKLPKITRDEEMDQYRVTFAGISFKVHAAYFEKLQRLYDRAQKARENQYPQSSSSSYPLAFEEVLFCMLCRYDMLQGAGLQASVPGRVMDALLQRLDCRMECFASPLNCRYERFASVFDLDRSLGSLGSFFDLPPSFFATGGCFEANPPFCEGVIEAMNSRILELLELTTKAPLMFVVIVPAWKDSNAYQKGLLQNTFLTEHLLLATGAHYYAEGTQHRRKGSFRPASFDTSILFYQNELAKTKWPLDNIVLDHLKQAFCDDPGIMDKTSNVTKKSHAESSDRKRTIRIQNNGDHDAATKSQESKGDLQSSDNKKAHNHKAEEKRPNKRPKVKSSPPEETQAQMKLLESLGLSKDVPEQVTARPGSKEPVVASKQNRKRKKK